MLEPPDPIAAVTHPDPYPYYARLVRDRPTARDEATGLWVFASAAEVTAALSNDACRVRPAHEPVPASLAGSAAGCLFGRLIRMRDDPARAPMRAALGAALGTLDGVEIAAAARRSLDLLHAGSNASTLPELADACVSRLPCFTVAALLGVPDSQVARTADLTSAFVRAAAPTSTAPERTQDAAAVAELLDVLRAIAPDRTSRGVPGHLLFRVRHAARRAGCDDEAAVLANVVGLLFQAHDATAGLIGNTLLALARDSELTGAVRADPARLLDLVREVARHDAPVQNTRRFAAKDTVVLDRELRAGDGMLLVLAAANRDPAANPVPERLLPARREARCFTFGLGHHACLGERMAVSIAAAGVRHMLERSGDLASLAPGGAAPGYRPSVNARIPRFTLANDPHTIKGRAGVIRDYGMHDRAGAPEDSRAHHATRAARRPG